MSASEQELKNQIKSGDFKRLYFLYGEENYLTSHYAHSIADGVVSNKDFADFNLHKFDGQDNSAGDILSAIEALPLMAEKKCVLVRDFDVAGNDFELLMEGLEDLPDYCVVVFWHDLMEIDNRKKAKWNKFIKAAEKSGLALELKRKTDSEIVKLLVSGAKKRKCLLSSQNAGQILQRCGSGLYVLLGELEKLCSAKGEGEIDLELIDALCVKNLEASVFELSKAIIQKDKNKSFDILYRLFSLKEDPISILAVLSSAFTDLYRAKVALSGGIYPASLSADFPSSYKGREFRLKNAARDVQGLDIGVIALCLDSLAGTDESMKSSSLDNNLLLERAVVRLISILS